MASETTRASDLIVPEVWGDAVMTTVAGKAVLLALADVDTDLVGQPGDTVHFPKFNYIGDADDLVEGVAMETTKLSMVDSEATIKEAGKAVELTDRAVLTAIGSPNDQARNQLALSIARKLDRDIRAAAESTTDGSPLTVTTGDAFGWGAFTAGTALFGDEYDPAEIAGIVIHSTQHTQLLNDPVFQSSDTFGPGAVVQRGQVGRIGSAPVFISDRTTTSDAGATYNALIIRRGAIAVKYKRRPVVESDRDILKRTNIITTNAHYAVKRVDDRGVVVVRTTAGA